MWVKNESHFYLHKNNEPTLEMNSSFG
jgi:hypothetical protein